MSDLNAWAINAAVTYIDNALRLVPEQPIPIGAAAGREHRTIVKARKALQSARNELTVLEGTL